MIVEFVGLMGAGKTTFHGRAVRRLGAQGLPVWTGATVGESCGAKTDRSGPAAGRPRTPGLARLRRTLLRARASWESRRLVLIALRHLFGSQRPPADILRGLRWFLTDLGNHWTARTRVPAQHIVLFDEGLVQRVFNIFVHGRGDIDLTGLKAYARTLPLPDVLVYLVVGSELAVTRTQTRATTLSPRFRRLKSEQRRRVFADAAQGLDVLIREIRASAPPTVRILVIETNDFQEAEKELDRQLAGELPRLSRCLVR